MPLLTVLLAAPGDMAAADRALTALRRALPRSAEPGGAVLLLCDLPDAPLEHMPQDALLLRKLQSGVMSVAQRRRGCAMLLVRRRVWDDASRLYLGRGQRTPAREVVSQLLTAGQTDAVFEAASVSPHSLRGRFDAVLLADASLSFAPDTPRRMLAALRETGASIVRAPVLHPPREAEPLVTRLLRKGFTLTPLLPKPDALPLLATPEALGRPLPQVVPSAGDCPFVAREQTDMATLLSRAHESYRRCEGGWPLLAPVLTLAALLLAAASGNAVLACLALILPELHALRRPSQLPGALVRLTLLPALAASALDARLARLFARSPGLRIALPGAAQSPAACTVWGALLLPLAAAGVDALVPLLPVSLLWLLAPVIVRALDSPVRERIPLSDDERLLLRGEAEALFHALQDEAPSDPAQRMLSHCGACLLGTLEADEAARNVQALLPALKAQLADAHAIPRACALTCAQLLRERMGQCDAALRPLPGELESLVLASPAPKGDGLLARLLCAALREDSTPLRGAAGTDAPANVLFLPAHLLRIAKPSPALLPLTHPHTYLARRALPPDHPLAEDEKTLLRLSAEERELRYLALADSVLDGAFAALFARSPVASPLFPAVLVRESGEPEAPARRKAVRTRQSQPHAAPQ